MKKNELKDYLIKTLFELGGSGTVLSVSKKFWELYHEELEKSGDLFYTWQYDIRWAASELRKQGQIKDAKESQKSKWELTDDTMKELRGYSDSGCSSVEAALQKIGKAVFVTYYYDFANKRLSEKEIGNKIYRTNPNAKTPDQSFRVPRARYIFDNNLQCEALRLVINSERVDPKIREKAEKILKNETEKQNQKS